MPHGWRWLWIFVTAFLVGTPAFSWGPGAHAYVAMRVFGPSQLEQIFAATAPDMAGLAQPNSSRWPAQHLTHFEFWRLRPSFFAAGFLTHNGEWGADRYAHNYYDHLIPETYLNARMRQWADEFGYTINQAEDVFEGTVDYMLFRDLGLPYAQMLADCASTFGPTQAQDVVDAFALPFSQQTGISLAEAQAKWRLMGTQMQVMVRIYGQQLAITPLPQVRALVVQGFAALFHVDIATADQFMARAEELAWDYQDELDAVAERVAAKLQTTEYAMPLGPWSSAVLVFSLAALFAVGFRRWVGQPDRS